MEASDLTHLSDEFIEGMMSNELFQGQSDLYMEEENSNEPDDVIILHMDIRETLRSLQKLVEQKIGVNLKGYKFWLQDAQELEPHKNLVDQCVKGEGLVQINVQIQTTNQRINIVDVLKPTEAALAALAVEANKNDENRKLQADDSSQDSNSEADKTCVKVVAASNGNRLKDNKLKKDQFKKYDGDRKTHADDSQDSSSETEKKAATKQFGIGNDKPVLNWVLDNKFKKEQARLKIPEDPNDWTVPQVKHWFQWAVRQFDLIDANISDWAITGKELCSLTHEEFRKKLPIDPGNVFWTHLQLLKECKFVSVVHKAAEDGLTPETSQRTKTTTQGSAVLNSKELKIMRKSTFHSAKNYSTAAGDWPPANNSSSGFACAAYGVGSGNNGQVQLWQFLLEILTDREHTDIIQWVGTEGEFKLSDPERVARLWGEKKNKPAMNYEKLSRALRYYYDGDMISKVPGKRFAYKFDCDLKLLIGYDAAELSQLVNEKTYINESVYLDHMNMNSDDE